MRHLFLLLKKFIFLCKNVMSFKTMLYKTKKCKNKNQFILQTIL